MNGRTTAPPRSGRRKQGHVSERLKPKSARLLPRPRDTQPHVKLNTTQSGEDVNSARSTFPGVCCIVLFLQMILTYFRNASGKGGHDFNSSDFNINISFQSFFHLDFNINISF